MDAAKMNRKNISSVETFFDSLLRDKLTKNLFYVDLPTTIKKDWKEVVVVDCTNPVRDYDSHSIGTVLIYLYVKQNAYGIKDVKTMQALEGKLNELIDGSNDEHYHVERRGSYGKYDAVNDIYFNVIQINLVIT